MSLTIKQTLYNPTITNFSAECIRDKRHVINKTTVEELVSFHDNTPVLDAQIRALTAALQSLKERKINT